MEANRGIKMISFEDMMRSSKAFQEAPTAKASSKKSGTNAMRHIVELDNENLLAKDMPEAHSDVSHSIDRSLMNEELDLPLQLLNSMYEHQKSGVAWLYALHLSKNHSGSGILGDDMGLGKTFQTVCLLTGLLRQRDVASVLIICPVSVLQSWQREIQTRMLPHVTKRLLVALASGDMSKTKREKILADVWKNATPSTPRIVISSYHLVTNMIEDFSGAKCAVSGGPEPQWDYVILDEGHIIKNPSTKMSQAMHRLPSKSRLILSGTPIQNNLTEFFALISWCTKGRLLGSEKDFKKKFMVPIEAGQDPGASAYVRELAATATKKLTNIVAPILLQRKKESITSMAKPDVTAQTSGELGDDDGQKSVSGSGGDGRSKLTLNLPDKTELAVWIPLSAKQHQLYEKYLTTRDVASALERARYPVEQINHLKTLCRHPFLIEAANAARIRNKHLDQEKASSQKGEVDILENLLHTLSLSSSHAKPATETICSDDETEKAESQESIANGDVEYPATDGSFPADDDRFYTKLPPDANVFDVACRKPSVEELLEGSVKLQVLVELVSRLRNNKHRILIFSQSRMIVDILQYVLHSRGLKTVRIDGRVTGQERQRIIDGFNRPVPVEENVDDMLYSRRAHIALLTTRACATGITLTGADRVILHDPSWNPAEDRQAVDRAYRIGQTRNVIVYRLILASTVEEKMYEKQVFKDGVRVVLEHGQESSSRYFSAQETKALFTLGPLRESIVLNKLWHCSGETMRHVPDTGGVLDGVLGYSRHDRLYEEAQCKSDTVFATKHRSPVRSPQPFTQSPAVKSARKSPMQFFNTYTKEDLRQKLTKSNKKDDGNMIDNTPEMKTIAIEEAKKSDIPLSSPMPALIDCTVDTPEMSFTPVHEVSGDALYLGTNESVSEQYIASEWQDELTQSFHTDVGSSEEDECSSDSAHSEESSSVKAEKTSAASPLQAVLSATKCVNDSCASPERANLSSSSVHTPLSDIVIRSVTKGNRRGVIPDSDDTEDEATTHNQSTTRLDIYAEDGFNNHIGGYDNFIPGVDDVENVHDNHQRDTGAEQLAKYRITFEQDVLSPSSKTESGATKAVSDQRSQARQLQAEGSPSRKRWSGDLPAPLVNVAGEFRLAKGQLNNKYSLPCYKLAAAIASSAKLEQYNSCLRRAQETRQNAFRDNEAEAAILCEALEICDEDVNLHRRLAHLLGTMGT